jgi:hypothetical protein
MEPRRQDEGRAGLQKPVPRAARRGGGGGGPLDGAHRRLYETF